MDYETLLARIDELYEGVVMNPAGWDDATLTDWMNALSDSAGEAPDRELARGIRRCVRAAQKMREFWQVDDPSRPADGGDWRTRVDLALGPRAWRPTLELALAALERAPSENLYGEVKVRYRVVNSERWMDGISFEEWRDEHAAR